MKIAIIGLGLIGGSIAFALKDFQNAEINGCDINPNICEKAIKSGAVATADTDPAVTVASADLVIFCVYPDQITEIIKDVKFKPGAVITEVSGIKSGLTEKLAMLLPDNVDFVPCHPMAGKEVDGFDYAEAELFLGAGFIITPLESTKPESILLIKQLAKHIGASEIACVSASEHDRIVAYTSHLCHLSALALCLNYPAGVSKAFLGGSFRDCTRVANINSVLWSSLFLENKDYVVNELERYTASLNALKNAVEQEDSATLVKLLNTARSNKAALSLNIV